MRHCSLCRKKLLKGNGTFFRVPKDKKLLDKWSKRCGMEFTPNSHICIDHFTLSDVVTAGRRLLLPSAMPILRQQKVQVDGRKNITPKDSENIKFEKPRKVFTANLLNLDNNVIPPHLQEDPMMHVPAITSVYCTASTQTNSRLCGLVQISGYSHEFRFNCFYCYEVFPLEKWKIFVNHLKEKHSEIEAFKMVKYVSGDHDYTPINLNLSAPVEATIETVIKEEPPTFLEDPLEPTHSSFEPVSDDHDYASINLNNSAPVETTIETFIKEEPPSFLEDPLEPTHSPFESVVFSPTFYYAPECKKSISNDVNILKNIETDSLIIGTSVPGMANKLDNSKKELIFCPSSKRKANNSKQTSNKTALSRCLKRTNNIEVFEPEAQVEYESVSIEIVQQKATEITFQYTPCDIVNLLLDSMKNYPVLWQFDAERFNEDFYEAVEDLCKIINDKWSLDIDNLKMRRSINRILRYYCYLFPNVNVENVDKFTNYYDKCAIFLPSSVNEVAYARCSHCYMCFRNDFNLKRHLLEEQKYLQWSYKCVQCKECFKESDEYEFHMRLPHYAEIFRCEPCNKKFVRRNIYNKHISEYHSKEKRPEYKCDVCSKSLQTKSGLKNHQSIHGERKYKCYVCSKSFFTNAYLSIHLKIHRKQYDFVCEVCGKEFIAHSALNRHMKKHTGAKVTCSICNLKLRKSSLRRHLRVVHEAYKESSEKTGRLKGDYWRLIKSRPLRPNQRKCEGRKYYCKICKIDFENYKLIVEHNKELHWDNPKWPCKMCNTKFSQIINLKQHYRKKHHLHVIQVFKLVNENEDLNVVLNMKAEFLDELTHNQAVSTNKFDASEGNLKISIKSDPFPNEIFLKTAKNECLTIDDEITKDANNILTQDLETDFTDFIQIS